MRNLISYVLLAVAISLSLPNVVRGSVAECLDRLERNRQAFRSYEVDGDILTSWVSSLRRTKQWHREEFEIKVDGDKTNCLTRAWDILSAKQHCPLKEATIYQILWDGTNYYVYNNSEVESYSNVVISAPEQSKGAGTKRAKYTVATNGPAPLYGFLPGDTQNILELLRGADRAGKCRVSRKVVNGATYDVVSALISGHGSYRIWFDPSHGGNIARVSVKKSSNDAYFGIKVSTPFSNDPRVVARLRRSGIPTVPKRQFLVDLTDVQFAQKGNTWVPVRGKWKTTAVYGDNTQLVTTSQCVVSSITIAPNFPGTAFKPFFKDGSSVRIEGHADLIPLRWQGGKVVASPNQGDLRTVDKQIEALAKDVGRRIPTPATQSTRKDLTSDRELALNPLLVGPPLGSSTTTITSTKSSRVVVIIFCAVLVLAAAIAALVWRRRRMGVP